MKTNAFPMRFEKGEKKFGKRLVWTRVDRDAPTPLKLGRIQPRKNGAKRLLNRNGDTLNQGRRIRGDARSLPIIQPLPNCP